MYMPRRLEVRLVQIQYGSKDTDKGNFLILNKMKMPEKFIFNEYKTSDTYGKQIIDVPDEIQDIIHKYILNNDLKNKDYLFYLDRNKREPYDEGAFSVIFSNVFKKVYGKHITNQMFRKSYATYFNKRAKNLGEKKKYANDLSHSLSVHLEYEKYNIKKNITII